MVNIGYFVERATVKDGNKNANMQFSGGILVPSKIEPSHFHDALKNAFFEAYTVVTGIKCNANLEKKTNSLMISTFDRSESDKWYSLDKEVREKLSPTKCWNRQNHKT